MRKFKLNFSSFFTFNQDIVTIKVGPRISNFLGIIISLILPAIFYVYKDSLISQIENNYHLYFIIGLPLIFIIQAIIQISTTTSSILDLSKQTHNQKTYLWGINIKTVKLQWEKPFYFNYKLEFDSYQSITAVWLTVNSEKTKESKMLIDFKKKEHFVIFQEEFNNNYPEYKILEWHD